MKVFWVVFFLCISLCSIHAAVISDPNMPLSQLQQEEISDLYEILLAVYDNNITLIPTEPNELLALETSEDSRDLLAWEIIKMIRGVWDPNSEYFDDTSSAALDEQFMPEQSSGFISNTPVEYTNDLSSVNITETSSQTLQFMEPVEELSNPLGSRILESKTYRITTLPLEIEGHVVIPAGAKLIAPYDPNSNIIEVMPGGLLDMGKAVNLSDPNFPDILPPVEILPEDPNLYFTHNNIGIYIRRGANPCTRIYNTLVTYCRIGIVADEALTNPIQNVITFGCYDGVHLYAPAAIIDCQFWSNGSIWNWMGEYIWAHFDAYLNGTLFEDENISAFASAAVYVHLDGEAFPYSEISIERAVMDTADVGLYVRGTYIDPNLPDPNVMAPFVPRISVVNNVLSLNNFYGLYKTEGQAELDVRYSAFAANPYYNTNVDLPYIGCFGISYDPFYLIEGRLYVDPESHLMNAGEGMASDGTGIYYDWPDIGPMDIGCHFPLGITGSFGIPASPADFNWDGIVDELDLELMDWCMGAAGDPNIVMFDTSYDSQINMPDFGLMSFDYGYSNDANLPGNHDPNCERSDFNGDHQVDLEDVRVLADYWLTKVFDEYRICSLCNLYRSSDPNEPEINAIIDSRDYDAFMAEWGKVSYGGCSVSFKKEPNEPVEPNSLSDEIIIRADNYPSITTWLFLQIDGSPAGLTYLDYTEEPVFMVPTYEFSNGYHTITIGGYTSEGGCWMENTRVQFRNNLYMASIPEMYEPNEPYEIRGFFDNGTVQISTDPNYYVSSDNGYIQYSSTVAGDNPVATIHYQNGEEAQTKTVTLTAAVDMSKVDPNSYRALILHHSRNSMRIMKLH